MRARSFRGWHSGGDRDDRAIDVNRLVERFPPRCAVVLIVLLAALGSSPAARAADATGWLDRGTASVLADDIGFDHFCGAARLALTHLVTVW